MCLDHGNLTNLLVVVHWPKGRMRVSDQQELVASIRSGTWYSYNP